MLRIGLLTIGQTPRPDLVEATSHLRGHADFIVRGALDTLSDDQVDALMRGSGNGGPSYPLITKLRSGKRVEIEERSLIPLLQEQLAALEAEGVTATLLLCAGPFDGLRGAQLLLKPFDLTRRIVQASGANQIGVIVPTRAQESAAQRKFASSGLGVAVVSLESCETPSMPIATQLCAALESASNVGQLPELVVMDYVGYPADELSKIREAIGVPLLDSGAVAIAALESILPC